MVCWQLAFVRLLKTQPPIENGLLFKNYLWNIFQKSNIENFFKKVNFFKYETSPFLFKWNLGNLKLKIDLKKITFYFWIINY
jgi:hypothetical protein